MYFVKCCGFLYSLRCFVGKKLFILVRWEIFCNLLCLDLIKIMYRIIFLYKYYKGRNKDI